MTRRRHRGPSGGSWRDWSGHVEGLLFLGLLGAAVTLAIWLAVQGVHPTT